jgi:hypothetical protein
VLAFRGGGDVAPTWLRRPRERGIMAWRSYALHLPLWTDAMPSTPDRFHYNLRALLLLLTAACVMLGVFKWILPENVPADLTVGAYVAILVTLLIAAWEIIRAKQRPPWTPPAEYVTVQVDAKWKRRVKSPLIFGPIAALTGVSVSFAPLALLWCGQAAKYGPLEWVTVSVSLLTIYLVPGFYMRLASEVIAQLVKPEPVPNGPAVESENTAALRPPSK